jgi:phosphinothricin acetyltransferase
LPEFTLLPLAGSDKNEVVDLFNYYVKTSFAAFPENPVPYEFYDMLMQAAHGYPSVAARERNGALAGFGMLRPYNPLPAFAHTAEVTFFIWPEVTGRGLGTLMLRYLEEEGKKRGISVILANVSSRNEGSIRFHAKNGFSIVGRFAGVGQKHGILFDSIWMEKQL